MQVIFSSISTVDPNIESDKKIPQMIKEILVQKQDIFLYSFGPLLAFDP